MSAALRLTGSPGAATDDIVLSWDAPAQCPVKADVIARVRARIAERPTARVEAEAVVEPSGPGRDAWHLRLWIRGDETVAEREIEAQSCDALAEATATILAVAATTPPTAPSVAAVIPAPDAARPDAAPAAVRVAPAATPRAAPSRATSEPARSPSPRSRPRARLGVLGGVDHGALPGTGGTLLAEAGVHWPRVRITGFGTYGFGRRVSIRDVAARHRLAAGGASICAVAPLGAFELGGCAGAELGALLSEGTRGRALRTKRSIWAAGSLGGFAGWRFASRWSLVLRVDAVVPAVRRQFFVGDELVGRIGPIGVRALGGLAVVLP
jgi:hypothetical protein